MRDPDQHPLRDGPAASGIGRRDLIRVAGASASAAAIGGLVPMGTAEAALATGASQFQALSQAVRVADTRDPGTYPFTRLASNKIRVQVRNRDGVPAEATSVVFTLTGVLNVGGARTFVTAYPTGSPLPEASNLNLVRIPDANANLAMVKVGTLDSIDIFSKAPCEIIVDLIGYFVPVSGAVSEGRFEPFSSARRVLDTRETVTPRANSFTTVDVTGVVPTGTAAFVNIAAINNDSPGFFSAVPATVNTVPTTSSLNTRYAGDIRAASVIVPVLTVGGRQVFKIYGKPRADLIVDVAGYFTNGTASSSTNGLFVPTEPTRVLDTRIPDKTARMWPRWVVEQKLPAPAATQAAAVVLNVTSNRTRGRGFMTVSAARWPIPKASNLNWTTSEFTVPNLAITRVTASYGFQIYNHSGGHAIADLAGYFTGTPLVATQAKYVNPPVPAAAPPWTITIPRLGKVLTAVDGDSNVVDAGYLWHWTGTGLMSQNAHVSVFGHRTDAGGPFRNIQYMQNGDTWTVWLRDAISTREYTYRMVRRDLTDAKTENILAATRAHPGPTMSLIACTVGYDRSKAAYPDIWAPTSIYWRIIVTGELVSWREL
jgi:sortase (surface protein transpeptidase)